MSKSSTGGVTKYSLIWPMTNLVMAMKTRSTRKQRRSIIFCIRFSFWS